MTPQITIALLALGATLILALVAAVWRLGINRGEVGAGLDELRTGLAAVKAAVEDEATGQLRALEQQMAVQEARCRERHPDPTTKG